MEPIRDILVVFGKFLDADLGRVAILFSISLAGALIWFFVSKLPKIIEKKADGFVDSMQSISKSLVSFAETNRVNSATMMQLTTLMTTHEQRSIAIQNTQAELVDDVAELGKKIDTMNTQIMVIKAIVENKQT